MEAKRRSGKPASALRYKLAQGGRSSNVEDKRPKYGGGSTSGLQHSLSLGKMIEDELASLIRVHNNPFTKDKTKSVLRRRMDQITAPNHKIRTTRLSI